MSCHPVPPETLRFRARIGLNALGRMLVNSRHPSRSFYVVKSLSSSLNTDLTAFHLPKHVAGPTVSATGA